MTVVEHAYGELIVPKLNKYGASLKGGRGGLIYQLLQLFNCLLMKCTVVTTLFCTYCVMLTHWLAKCKVSDALFFSFSAYCSQGLALKFGGQKKRVHDLECHFWLCLYC